MSIDDQDKMIEGLTSKRRMLPCQKEQEVQQRRIEQQQHLLQAYRKAVVVDLPQEEVVALVQTAVVVHSPGKGVSMEEYA
jgi:hypothetical protein